MLLKILTLVLLLISATAVHAQKGLEVLKQTEEVYIPKAEDCARDDICDLKKITFRVQSYRIPATSAEDIELYGTKMYLGYNTASLSDITKYAVVQFIRGCVYRSELLPTNEVNNHFTVMRRHIDTPGGFILFRHPTWIVDSTDQDPLYSSNPDTPDNRHFFLQWSPQVVKGVPRQQGVLYGEKLPLLPNVYVTNSPEPATLDANGVAKNVSLQFETCVFKTANVSRGMRGNQENFGPPLVCFAWSHNFVYDHTQKVWQEPNGISPVCNRPLTPDERDREELLRRWSVHHPHKK